MLEQKNSHAVSMLQSWLDALYIDNELSDKYDLTVQDSEGNPVEVRVSDNPIAGENTVFLKSSDLTGEDIAKALFIFRQFVESLGFPYLDPVNRGLPPTKAIHSKDDFESVYLRHCDIRRSTNPDKEHLFYYNKIINNVSKFIYNKGRGTFMANSVDIDDLKSIAMTHVVSYISLYEIPECFNTNDDNLKKCHSFLVQRLFLYLKMLNKKGKNCRTASIYAKAYDIETIDEDYIERHNVFKSKQRSKRKQEAKNLLKANLEAMSHDDMIDTLTLASTSNYMHSDANKLAKQILNDHYMECNECLSKESKKEGSMDLRG